MQVIYMERVQKIIANNGYCSRRKAEELIKKGKVRVNGEVVRELGTLAGPNDTIMVDDDIWQYSYISHEVQTNYENLKNDIIVLGKTHTASQYSNDCTYDDTRHAFVMSCAGIKREKNHIKLAFTTPSNMSPTIMGTQYYLNLNGYIYWMSCG